MTFLIKIALFFGALYLFIGAHFMLYDRFQKHEALMAMTEVMKEVRASRAFQSDAYQRFVYVP